MSSLLSFYVSYNLHPLYLTGVDFVEGKTTCGLLCVVKNTVLKSIFGNETDGRYNPKRCLTFEIRSLPIFRNCARCSMHKRVY